MKILKTLPAAMLLLAGWTGAQAAADFITIQRSQVNLGDTSPRLLVNFTLPADLNDSSLTANSAVLVMDVNGAEFNYNEIYVNPPTTVCTSNNPDANQPTSLGMLREHDDINMKTEWSANHIAFSSALLLPGTNQLMICVRNNVGDAGSAAGNLDNVSIKSVVLHYHTDL